MAGASAALTVALVGGMVAADRPDPADATATVGVAPGGVTTPETPTRTQTVVTTTAPPVTTSHAS